MNTETSTLSNLLTQEEIDTLLTPAEDERTALPLLLQQKKDQELFPEFKQKIDSLARYFVPTIQELTQSQNVSVSLYQFSVNTLGAYLDAQNASSAIGIYSIEQIRQSCLIALDYNLAYTLIDMSMGGRRGNAALQMTGRTYTQIEKNILCSFLQNAATPLQDIWDEKVVFENLNTTPSTALIASPACEVIVAQFQTTIDHHKAFFDVVIPVHVVTQLQPTEEKQEDADNDLLAQALLTVPVTLKAVLDKKQVPFSKILKWKKGDLLDLSYFDDSPLDIMCANKTFCRGSLHVDKKMFFVTVKKE